MTDAERRNPLGVDRRFHDRLRAATDKIGRGIYTGPERRTGERRSA
jgi:hypothetical protein